MSFIKFTVREDGREFPLSMMSEPECAAIQHCVEDLVPIASSSYWLEVDTLPELTLNLDEEDLPYGIVICYTHNPNPANGSLGESRLQHPFPEDIRKKLQGKTFTITPRQLGLNPWGKKVEVTFEEGPKEKKD